jgi:negative regulator of sigma E activity
MREKISAFIDGELEHADSLDLVEQLGKDKELHSYWQRYHIYGSAMRNEVSSTLSVDFSARVMTSLEQEPVQLAPSSMPRRKKLTGPVAGLAVAASLVGIAVLLVKPGLQENTETGAQTVAKVVSPQIRQPGNPRVIDPEQDLIVANSKNENVRERINRLLVEHNQYNPASDMTGMMPYSRFVGYTSGTDRP